MQENLDREMCRLFDHIAASNAKSPDPVPIGRIVAWLLSDQLGVVVTPHMTASFRTSLTQTNTMEIVHVGGDWCDGCAKYSLGVMFRTMAEAKIDNWRFQGRPGWARFLRTKGFDYGNECKCEQLEQRQRKQHLH